jgi:hypothetical protein
MVRWQGYSRLNDGDEGADPAPSATVTVYRTGTGIPATLYAANDLAQPKANPFTAGLDGFGFFYAANGRYDIQFSGGGITTPWSLGDVLLFDPGSLLS